MAYEFKENFDGAVYSEAQPHGHEADGTPLWVARTVGDRAGSRLAGIQLGKVRPGLGAALIPYRGQELAVQAYFVLMQAGIWLPASEGRIPEGAVVCGHEEFGDPLFIARAKYQGGVHPGKIAFGRGVAFISWGGQEVGVHHYEVLVSQDDLTF